MKFKHEPEQSRAKEKVMFDRRFQFSSRCLSRKTISVRSKASVTDVILHSRLVHIHKVHSRHSAARWHFVLSLVPQSVLILNGFTIRY